MPSSVPVLDNPLAFCDAQTTTKDDVVEVDDIRGSYIASTQYGRYRPGFKWHYLSHQTRDEVVMMKMFDTADVDATFCIHTGFLCSEVPKDCISRESIEVRVLVFSGKS